MMEDGAILDEHSAKDQEVEETIAHASEFPKGGVVLNYEGSSCGTISVSNEETGCSGW